MGGPDHSRLTIGIQHAEEALEEQEIATAPHLVVRLICGLCGDVQGLSDIGRMRNHRAAKHKPVSFDSILAATVRLGSLSAPLLPDQIYAVSADCAVLRLSHC